MTPLRIMIVEDDALVATLLADFLTVIGHGVGAIEDTEAGAVAAARRERPDLMIVDANLSAGSGVSAVKTILRSGFIPHIFISGDRLWGPSISPQAVTIQKPFFDSDIIRAIDRAMAAGATGAISFGKP